MLAFIIWVAAGTVCAMTYKTDAVPDYVIRQEALIAGLLAPICLAEGIACNFSGGGAAFGAGWGSLALFIFITIILLTRRSTHAILFTAALLVSVLAASIILLLRSYTIGVG